MRYKSKIISCFLIICLLVSVLYTDKMLKVSAAGSSKSVLLLKIDNQTVSGETVSIEKGKKKKLKVIIPQKKMYKITFRSNKGSIAAVSKTGEITAKGIGTAKVTVVAKLKKKKYKGWIKVKVVSTATVEPSDTPPVTPSDTPTVAPSDTPSVMPSVTPTTTPTESPAPDIGTVSDMYEITIRVNGKEFPAKLYQTETTKSIMQKLPLSITMDELNGNEKYYYFSESFQAEPQRVSEIRAGDLKLYGSSCLVLFYKSFSTSYSYTSLGYLENTEGLAEALGTGSVHVDIIGS